MAKLLKYLAVIPSLGLVAAALTLLGTALAGSSDLPAQARSLTTPQQGEAPLVAPAPARLSSAVVVRDWVEVSTSESRLISKGLAAELADANALRVYQLDYLRSLGYPVAPFPTAAQLAKDQKDLNQGFSDLASLTKDLNALIKNPNNVNDANNVNNALNNLNQDLNNLNQDFSTIPKSKQPK